MLVDWGMKSRSSVSTKRGWTMKRLVLPLALLATAPALPPPHAAGTLTRAFVSSAGNDSNPCSITAPCATFAAAYAAVVSNGIIAALDPGKYGPLTNPGPVTIDGYGWAAITAPSMVASAAITINAHSGDKVSLRGLILDGAGAANTTGINFNSGASLNIESCVVRNMTASGLSFQQNATTAQALAVSDSHFNNNGPYGVVIDTVNSGNATSSFDRTEFDSNVDSGINAFGLGTSTGINTVAVTDSVASNNGSQGFWANSSAGAGGIVIMTLTRSLVVGNAVGVETQGTNAKIWLAQSTVTGNGSGYLTSGGTINTFVNNYITDTNNTGSLTPAGKQ